VAGLRKKRAEYERRLALLEEAGLASGSAALRAGDLIDRGQVYCGFGDAPQARRCFLNALSLAETHKLGQFVIQAEEGLRLLEQRGETASHTAELPAISSHAGIEEIREELQLMRELSPELAGV
jgi:hypothetical protein